VAPAVDDTIARHGFRAMGSPCEIRIDGEGTGDAAQAVAHVVAEVDRLERRYSRFREDSDLSAINRVAAEGGRIEVDAETAGLLDYAEACYVESAGRFDVTSGVLRKAWRFGRDAGGLPEPKVIEALLARVGWRRLEWQRPWLVFPEPGLELDLGGIVKEYAADCAARVLSDAGIEHALVNLGGDVRAVGPRADGAPWRIGVRHPRRPDGLVATVSISEGALATSGDYERCIEVEGVRYGHVLDPRTGWPVRHLASVTVLAPLCVVAGSASTIALLSEQAGPSWLESMELPHLWIDVEGRMGGSLCALPRETG